MNKLVPRLRFFGRCRNLEFTITITITNTQFPETSLNPGPVHPRIKGRTYRVLYPARLSLREKLRLMNTHRTSTGTTLLTASSTVNSLLRFYIAVCSQMFSPLDYRRRRQANNINSLWQRLTHICRTAQR